MFYVSTDGVVSNVLKHRQFMYFMPISLTSYHPTLSRLPKMITMRRFDFTFQPRITVSNINPTLYGVRLCCLTIFDCCTPIAQLDFDFYAIWKVKQICG